MSSTVRTFRAADARAAIAAVKAALGPDAIIISTREIDCGLFRPSEIEVTAALTTDDAANEPSKADDFDLDAPELRQTTRAERQRAYLRPADSHSSIAPPSEVAEELLRLRSSMEEVRQEIRVASGHSRTQNELKLAPAAADLFAHLCLRGVEETLAEEAVRQAVSVAKGASPTALLASIREVLGERLVAARAPWLRDRRRIIALVGPTGVGKTTTLAKIAARALMESSLKVALITVDTFRIGASEQVARYGEIMNVPTFVARDRTELARAVEHSVSADLVLIDTAGRSLSEAVARQAEMIRSVPFVQLYLVVSAATGAREIAAVAERYRSLCPERLVITKVDEAAGPGSLLSAAVRIGRPISAVADGQRVPEDVQALTGPQLAELVIGTWTGTRADAAAGGRR